MAALQSIDLRSDTMTRPNAAMRRAMAEAEVGDDVWGEDPTVRRLEEEAAAAMGMEAALFVPSGIMGNSIGLSLHAPRGSEILCDHRAHILLYEAGAPAAVWGLLSRPLPSTDGLPAVETFRAAISSSADQRVPTGVMALENSHNVAGGVVFGRDRLDPIVALARQRGVPLHLDGARIWNAAVALGTTPAALVDGFSTVSFCLSKGLGAPVGSLVCGSAAAIAVALERRRMLGGAMRQVGVLAAAGLVALREGPERLADDHAHARLLAEAVAESPGLEIDLATVQSNIVIFRVSPREGEAEPAARWVTEAARQGLLAGTMSPDEVRFVTHRDIDRAAIDRAVEILLRLPSQGSA
jgi:threonine aldolase